MAGTLLHHSADASVGPAAPPVAPARSGGTALALAAWCALIGVAHFWGDRLLAGGRHLELELPPLRATLDPRFGVGAIPVLALGVAAVVWGPALAARLPWPRLLVASALAAAAFAVALPRLWGRGAWLLPGAALAAVTLADLSGLSKAEVERIWLPFAPFVLVATGALATRATAPARAARGWLGLQVTAALALQLVVRTKW